MSDFKALMLPMLQSIIRYAIVAVVGWAGAVVSDSDIDTAAKVLGGVSAAVVVLLWSYINKKQVLHTTPPTGGANP